jgi:phosphonopyruvate decarboxylase
MDRLPQLRTLLAVHRGVRPLRILETHNGLTGLIAEHARGRNVYGDEVAFDGMWSSSLTASASQGKPDIEQVDTTNRLALVRETLDVTSKPLIYDADTGGHPQIFAFTVRSLEQMGASACIIEDKTGLKQNSLFGTSRKQELDDIDAFCEKIRAGQAAKRESDFMIISRLEALIAGHGQDEALKRAVAYVEAGTDGVMIHSKEGEPEEILTFLDNYHAALGSDAVPVVCVPTTYNQITEDELHNAGVSVCIYANHMLRAAYPSMMRVAETILEHGRSLEADQLLLPVKRIISMIDENPLNPSAADERATTSAVKSKPAEKSEKSAKQLVDPEDALAHLVHAEGVKFYCGVPDSLLAPFCSVVAESAPSHVIAANEGAAIATAAGHHLATGEVPLVYLQNSGLGNTVNPIVSLAHNEVYGCPMVLMVGWRGAPGIKDEPQHLVQGRQMRPLLAALNIQQFTLPRNHASAKRVLSEAVAAAKAAKGPVAVLVPPSTFAGSKTVDAAEQVSGDDRQTREAAIAQVLSTVGPDDAVISTTGYTSREVYELREKAGMSHNQDFLCVGSMGHALAIAQGIASAQPARTVWCLDGDGAAIMHLGSMATCGAAKLPNLRHVLLNNRKHDSVGGQPTAAAVEGAVDFTKLSEALGYGSSGHATNADELAALLAEKPSAEGASFIEVNLKAGTRSDLARPTTTTGDAKIAFTKFLQTSSGR